jgi:hypothetical protein
MQYVVCCTCILIGRYHGEGVLAPVLSMFIRILSLLLGTELEGGEEEEEEEAEEEEEEEKISHLKPHRIMWSSIKYEDLYNSSCMRKSINSTCMRMSINSTCMRKSINSTCMRMSIIPMKNTSYLLIAPV